MDQQYFEQLKRNYLAALNKETSDAVRELNMEAFCGRYEPQPEWCVGPFRRDDRLTFRKTKPLADPTGIGWTSSFLFNPSLLVKDDRLWLFYRAGVKKESLGSRIGLAVWSEETGWQEYAEPVIWPTEPNEVQSVEDPKVYRTEDGTFVMFYNGIYNASPQQAERYGAEPGAVCVDLLMAVSSDLIHWEKHGSVVPKEISRLWVKAAVIPRAGDGSAVRTGGKYQMFLSEGCGGRQYIGESDDLLHWSFRPQTYLELPPSMGTHIYEVACAMSDPVTNDLLLDFFYSDTDGRDAAAQAFYPAGRLDAVPQLHRGGTLAWGGLSVFRGEWIFPQGWDSPEGKEEIYFYTAPVGSFRPR